MAEIIEIPRTRMTTDYAELARELRKCADDLGIWIERIDEIVSTPGDLAEDDRSDIALMRNAATALEHLSAENARLREALQTIAGMSDPKKSYDPEFHSGEVARATLQQGDKK